MNTTRMKAFDGKFILILLVFVAISALILFIPSFLYHHSYFNYSSQNQDINSINNSVSITIPFLTIAGALLTFLAFWVQYKANEWQQRDLKIERFENKFYELIHLHKENVSETKIESADHNYIEGRKTFVLMYYELRFSFYVAKLIYERLHAEKKLLTKISDESLLGLAYIFFYSGVGPSSDLLTTEMIGGKYDELLTSEIRDKLLEYQKEKPGSEISLQIGSQNEIRLKIRYKLFAGHMSRFGHYYRHLFQTVKFVILQDSEIIPIEQKKDYLRTLRAQLSDHEQVMLYYNALSGFGEKWIIDGYFTDWKMIHNIPLPLAHFGKSPQIKFSDYIEKNGDIFEWTGA